MKALWKGSISFGLVTIPVKLYKATEERTLKFHQLHASCPDGRIKYKRVCSTCNQEVGAEAIVRGYEYDKGRHVVLTDAELDRGVPQSRAIAIKAFVSPEDVDSIYFHDSYYLGPDQIGATGYRLLAEAMRQKTRMALATLGLRDKERPAVLRLCGEVMVLHTLYWPDEVRAAKVDHLDASAELRPQELEMACSLVENLAGEYDPTELHDTYRERLEAVVAAKIDGTEPVAAPIETTGKVLDLMDALRASIEASSQPRSARA